MDKKLEHAFEILAARRVWENKQRMFYQMRHDGLRRVNKPFPTAADSHFPLVDMAISKWKPFWLSQAFSAEKLAQFISMRQQLAEMSESAGDYFDFTLRQRTCFEEELESCIDTMLLRGRGVLKAVVDPFEDYEIKFTSIDPLYILMPNHANDFEDADYFIEVQRTTVSKYRRERNYEQSNECIEAIRGRKDFTFESLLLDKQLREGITHSTNNNEVLLWHYHERTPGGWNVYTLSPQAEHIVIRRPYQLPYSIGGKPSLPYHSFSMEVKDKGWYSPRGCAELVAAFEAYCCKLWNEKADAMTFGNRPLFTTDRDMPNISNIKFMPGELVPGNIRSVTMPSPAISFDQEMNFTRELAEVRLMMPDFGVSRDGSNQKRTATENERIAALSNVGVDHNGRVFKRRLVKLYRHCWGLCIQYKQKEMVYYTSNDLKTMPEQALHDQYLIMPDASPDGWDKSRKVGRAMARLEAFRGAPNVNQDELVRDVIASDDARLVSKLLIPSTQKAANEAEDEAMEISILQDGFPASVMPGEDHATRIGILVGWLQKQSVVGAPLDPLAKQRVMEHLSMHYQYLHQTQPEAAQALGQQFMAMEQSSTQPALPGAPNGNVDVGVAIPQSTGQAVQQLNQQPGVL
jgi:hypothetical protein